MRKGRWRHHQSDTAEAAEVQGVLEKFEAPNHRLSEHTARFLELEELVDESTWAEDEDGTDDNWTSDSCTTNAASRGTAKQRGVNTGNRWGNGFFRACRDFFHSPNNEDDPEDAEWHQYVWGHDDDDGDESEASAVGQCDNGEDPRLGQADPHQDDRGALDTAVGATK